VIRRSTPVLAFLGRRLLSALVALLGSTFLVFLLLSAALDPLEDLYTSTAPNRDQLIQERVEALDLDTPAPVRYLGWLRGVAGCAVGQCDLGTSWVDGRPVLEMLRSAIPSTLLLVGAAAVIAILLGVTVGVVSALRQGTGIDHGTTFLSFVLYSLPAFWVAVLLKLWGAVGFNDLLADPRVPWPVLVGLSALAGVLWQAVVGGDARRRLLVAGVAAGTTGVALGAVLATGWLLDPRLGPAGVGLLGVAAAVALAALTGGLRDRRVLGPALAVVLLGVALHAPLQHVLVHASTGLLVALAAVAAGVGALLGRLLGGPAAHRSVRVAASTALVVGGLVVLDRLLGTWAVYSGSAQIGGRPIATIGPRTPGLEGDFWVETLDRATHLVLPTIALVLVSFAAYTRYTRASLIEVMHQDHVRNARSLGLPERVVVLRHGLRNALIPLATIVPLDLANLVGGAVITERVFAWSGMGTMFLTSLDERDLDPAMGYVLVVGALLVVANVVVDLLYAALDPRIRVAA
jgi:peptide/nickel transport system permease protein